MANIQNRILKDYVFCYGYRNATTDEPTDQGYVRRATTSRVRIPNAQICISINGKKGYQFSVTEFNGTKAIGSSDWTTSVENYETRGDSFSVCIRRIASGNEQDLNLTGFGDFGLVIEILDAPDVTTTNRLMESRFVPGDSEQDRISNIRRHAGTMTSGQKILCHMFIDNLDHPNQIEIPCQSLANIEIAHRLGYRMFELNVHPTATKGQWVCMHGVSGKIGPELVAKDGTDISGFLFGDVSADTFRNDYVYRTKNKKYRTHVAFLDEALTLLKRYNMIPYVQFPSGNYQIIEYIRRYVGDNFILYYTHPYYINRATTYHGVVNYYGKMSANELDDLCKAIQPPFIYSITPDQVKSYSDTGLAEMVSICHRNGCAIAFAGAYQTPQQNIRCYEMGFDICGANWDVEDFDNGNLLNLHDNETFNDFYYGGSVKDGILTLTNEKWFSTALRGNDYPFLAKGSLKIRFNGKIKLYFGRYMDGTEFTSDGNKELWFSTWFMHQHPNFSVQAFGTVEVYSCVYNASVC